MDVFLSLTQRTVETAACFPQASRPGDPRFHIARGYSIGNGPVRESWKGTE
jgi:hypothetical protein